MITVKIPTMPEFWRSVALFAYRRWALAETTKPTGVPGNRDPEHPCGSFAPRDWIPGDWHDCQTDGHYLCAECAHRAPPEPEEDDACTCQHWPTHCAEDCPIHGQEDEAQASNRFIDKMTAGGW